MKVTVALRAIDIDVRNYNFLPRILDIVDEIPKTKAEIVAVHHLARSGTSVGATLGKSRADESRLDFTHKLNIAH